MKQKNIKSPKVVVAAIAGLVILEVAALFNGINGTLFTLVAVAVAGLGGWAIPFPKK